MDRYADLRFTACAALALGRDYRPAASPHHHVLPSSYWDVGLARAGLAATDGVLLPSNPYARPSINGRHWRHDIAACFGIGLRLLRGTWWITHETRNEGMLFREQAVVFCVVDASIMGSMCVVSCANEDARVECTHLCAGDMLLVYHAAADVASMLFAHRAGTRFAALVFEFRVEVPGGSNHIDSEVDEDEEDQEDYPEW